MDLSMNGHHDEADAILLLDAVFNRICHAHRETLTKCAQEMQDQMVEVLESWLPPHLQITENAPELAKLLVKEARRTKP